jgi:transcriptional regulator with PAS, ATPase and Fis domain
MKHFDLDNPIKSSINIQRLLNHVPLGVMILDHERRVGFFNQALEAIIGMPADSATGLACHNILRSRVCITGCPLADGEELTGMTCLETDLINRDRKIIPVRLTFAPIYDAHNQPAGFVETIEDLRLLKEFDEKAGHAYSFGDIIGKSLQMEKLFRILPVIAQSDASVLITGETGTGKDMLAESLHQASERAKAPFVKINCGALPETLLESELFGHTKGAFTGAVENKQGRFHLAHTGTLYLTEIGDLPLPLQVKLLTFLDDKVVYPLGSTKGFAADVRIMAATHRDLEQMVRQGRFRQDLFFRLNVLQLHVPPLREREGDIRLLLDYFLNLFTQKLQRSISGYSTRALKMLLVYDYPGNVRELRNMVEYAVNICQDAKIFPAHLPAYLTENRSESSLARQSKPDGHPPESQPRTEEAVAGVGAREANWPRAEKQMIMNALYKAKGNRGRAAALIGWSRSTLWRKMKHYGIDAHDV